MTLSGIRRIPLWLWAGSSIPLGWSAFLLLAAPAFAWDIYLVDRPILFFVLGFLFVSAAFFLFVLYMRKESTKETGIGRSGQLLFIITVGLLARAILFPGPAILEDDFYRYQWDGQVTAAGLDPYAEPPASFVIPPVVDDLLTKLGKEPSSIDPRYGEIAEQGHETLLRTNNPHISTIYSPLTQLAFAAAQILTPWEQGGWKLIVLLCELVCLIALLAALRALDQPVSMVAIYWWNPLVLKELSNSMHMDALLMPVLAVMIWLCVTRRRRWMAVATAIAAAIKFWPLLVLPALWRQSRSSMFWGMVAGGVTLLLLAPQIMAIGENAGLTSYAAEWQRNSLAFPLLVQVLSPVFDEPSRAVRYLVAAMLSFAAFQYWRQKTTNIDDLLLAAGTLILFLCLLSPTGYPWYALWLLPFAAIMPKTPWLLLMACAPFYYVDFLVQIHAREEDWLWISGLLSTGPVWFYMIATRLPGYRNKRSAHA